MPPPAGAPKHADALSKLFDRQARDKLKKDPKKAAQDAGLPQSLVQHFDIDDEDQVALLASTWDELVDAGLTQKAPGGGTVAIF